MGLCFNLKGSNVEVSSMGLCFNLKTQHYRVIALLNTLLLQYYFFINDVT